MTFNKLPTVGADLSRTPPIYRPSLDYPPHRPSVGADLSRTSPIYRPSLT